MQNMRVCAWIDEDAILHNFNIIKNSLPENVKVMSVIKADAYGHGAKTFANSIGGKSDYLAVAIVEEALEIRKSEVNTPILVFGHSFPNDFKAALENDITLTVLSFEEAEVLSVKDDESSGMSPDIYLWKNHLMSPGVLQHKTRQC